MSSWADSEGETGKSQVIWVSIGIKQLDTTIPLWKKLEPPENVGPPLEPWKRVVFIKVTFGLLDNMLRTKKTLSELFMSDGPESPLKKIPASACGIQEFYSGGGGLRSIRYINYPFPRFQRRGGGMGGFCNFFQRWGVVSNCLFPIETNMTCDFPVSPSGSAHEDTLIRGLK